LKVTFVLSLPDNVADVVLDGGQLFGKAARADSIVVPENPS